MTTWYLFGIAGLVLAIVGIYFSTKMPPKHKH
jgi:hypothetical protein